MKMVEIEWVDSKSGLNEWEYLDDLDPLPPVRCMTAGYLLDDSPEYKTIVQSKSDSQIHGRITIPKACILSITEKS